MGIQCQSLSLSLLLVLLPGLRGESGLPGAMARPLFNGVWRGVKLDDFLTERQKDYIKLCGFGPQSSLFLTFELGSCFPRRQQLHRPNNRETTS